MEFSFFWMRGDGLEFKFFWIRGRGRYQRSPPGLIRSRPMRKPDGHSSPGPHPSQEAKPAAWSPPSLPLSLFLSDLLGCRARGVVQ